jgi:hypothetical protein
LQESLSGIGLVAPSGTWTGKKQQVLSRKYARFGRTFEVFPSLNLVLGRWAKQIDLT